MHRPLFWFLLLGLLTALAVIFFHSSEGTVGPLSVHDFGALAYRLALLVFLGATAIVLFRRHFAQALKAALLWIVVGFALVGAYSYRFELRDILDHVLAELVPGHAITRGRTVEIARTSSGDFAIAAQINGARVAMVLDTGASSVVLTREAAKAAGLPLEVLDYTVSVETANGRARAAPVKLDHVAIGGLVERSVDALVAQPGQLRTSLLGMSFLNRLQSWEVRGDRLFLRGYP